MGLYQQAPGARADSGGGGALAGCGPTHAGPASGGSVMAVATASRSSQPLLLAQSVTQPEEAVQLEKRRQQEQQELLQKQQQQKQQQIKSKKAAARHAKGGGPGSKASPGGGAAHTRQQAVRCRGYPG